MMSAISGHYGLFEAIRYKRHRQAMLLAEAGIDVDCRNEKGQTPLIYTVVAVDDCSRSRAKLVKLFLEAGADPNAADWKGLTALMHASILGQAETVKPLLECVWTNPCVTDPNGNTALMYAASHGQQEVLAVFLSVFRNNLKSLQLHKRNTDGFTALHLAVRNRHDACSRLLTKEGQFFPTVIDEFPDPKDLDRDPTPTDNNEVLTIKQKYSPEDKRTTGTMTLDPEDLDLISDSYLSILECSVGDLPAWNFTHPFGLQTNKSTQVVSVDQRRPTPESRQTTPENVAKECEEVEEEEHEESEGTPETPLKIDDWPVIPLQLKPVPQKLLQPLMPIEVNNVEHSNGNTYQRKCLLKQGNRGMSGLRIKIHDARDISVSRIRNGQTVEESDGIISGSSIKSVHLKRNKQSNVSHEIVTNVLPLIPSKDSNLPPVRYSLRRAGSSKKESVCFPAAPLITVRADQTPREMEMFKKNVVVYS
ncbi:hypothetical protein JTE90_018093 [Oedothorax gibbosus]|uniref:Uncharacterized protein n=1 Tax=Oedothorax gibbosus TaxID=931172 RepID=A0AAV6UFX0_9ARAC|nr:hypothetical protein JTE90_018093 [Oedothorax gibbosus]